MHFELADYYADEGVGLWVDSLRFVVSFLLRVRRGVEDGVGTMKQRSSHW